MVPKSFLLGGVCGSASSGGHEEGQQSGGPVRAHLRPGPLQARQEELIINILALLSSTYLAGLRIRIRVLPWLCKVVGYNQVQNPFKKLGSFLKKNLKIFNFFSKKNQHKII